MKKTKILQIRLEESEKVAFSYAADLAGVPISAWVRERLRRAATKELAAAGYEVLFIDYQRLNSRYRKIATDGDDPAVL